MKKIYFLILLWCLANMSVGIAQTSSTELDVADYAVARQSIKINGLVPLGASQQEVIQHLGEPEQTTGYEFFSYWVTVLRYGSNRFPFIDDYGRLTMFELNDDLFYLQIDDLSIRVGDTIDALAQRYPKIYANTWTSKLTGEKAVSILYSDISTRTGEAFVWDDYLVILRNNAGIITKIYEYGHY